MADDRTDSANRVPTPDDFDEWYTALASSPARDAFLQQHLGLPPDLLSTSLLGRDGLEEVVSALQLGTGGLLLDLACGRGGLGLEAARRCGARLVGVDCSRVAVQQATTIAQDSGVEATFRVGAMEHTGLDDDSVDAILCVDSVQLSSTPPTAYAEMRRVLRPGGHLVLTTWQPLGEDDDLLPQRLRQVDCRLGLTAAGFDEVEVHTRPEWLEREIALWRAALDIYPGDDVALADLREEAEEALPRFLRLERVVATAVAPA